MLQLQPSVLSLVCASDSGLNVSDREDSVLSAQQAVVPGRLPLPGAGVQRPAYPVLRVRPHPAQHGVPRDLISHATWYTTRCTMTIVPDTRDEDKATDMATYASLRLDLWVGQMPRDHISLHGMLPARCMSQQIRRIQTDTLRGAISRAPCRMLLAVVWPELQDVGRGMCALLVECCCPLSHLGTCCSWVGAQVRTPRGLVPHAGAVPVQHPHAAYNVFRLPLPPLALDRGTVATRCRTLQPV